MKFIFMRLVQVGLVWAATSLLSHAGIALYTPQTWSNTPYSAEGWTNLPFGTGLASLTNPGGYLNIRFSDQGAGPPAYEEDTVYANGSSYTGSYYSAGGIRFSFYAEDILPLSSVLYMHSGVDASLWEFAFSNTMAGVWQQQDVPLAYSAGWSGPGGAAAFSNALANIDWIGVNIARAMNTIQQDYGLDDWEYYIPEPGATCLLAAALLALWFAWRRRTERSSSPAIG